MKDKIAIVIDCENKCVEVNFEDVVAPDFICATNLEESGPGPLAPPPSALLIATLLAPQIKELMRLPPAELQRIATVAGENPRQPATAGATWLPAIACRPPASGKYKVRIDKQQEPIELQYDSDWKLWLSGSDDPSREALLLPATAEWLSV